MPFLGYADLDLYIISLDLVGRTDNYEISLNLVGRTDNYDISLNLVGRTDNYKKALDLNGATMGYYKTLPIEGKTSDKVNYVCSMYLSGTTQKTDLYQYSLSIMGTTALLPGSTSHSGSGATPGTGPTGPGPGSTSPGSNSGDGSFGGESLVFHIEHEFSLPMVTYPLISFSAEYTGTGTPTGNITILGQVSNLPGDIYVSSKATDVNGVVYQATYGPFKSVGGYEQTKTNNGWVTKFYFKDTTLEDTTQTEDPSTKMPELPELVPWEIEKTYTPKDQAIARRQRDLLERELKKKLSCLSLSKALYDGRSMGIDELVLKALRYLPIPYVLTSPPPFPGSKIYAEQLITNGGYANPAGTLIGTTATTAGKTPLDVMGEFWGAVGYTYKIVRGIVYIGQKDKIAEAEIVAEGGKLNMAFLEESNLLSKYSIEKINETATTSTTPKPASGSYSLPSAIIITGASYRKWLPPLDTEPPVSESTTDEPTSGDETGADGFEANPNGRLTTTKDIRGQFTSSWETGSITYPEQLIAVETTSTEKKGGLLSKQSRQRDGFVKTTFLDGSESYYWRNQYVEEVVYKYTDSRFDLTATEIVTTRAKVDQEGIAILGGVLRYLSDIIESETVTKKYHYSGYLMSKTVVSNTLDYFISSTQDDVANGVTPIYRYPVYKNTSTTETYRPIGGGRWLKEIVSEIPRKVRTVKSPTDTTWSNGGKYGTTLESYSDTLYTALEETDTPPEYATKTDTSKKDGTIPKSTGPAAEVVCVGEPDVIKNGYSYDEPVKFTLFTGGRGEPINVNLPFLTSAPGGTMTSTLSDIADRYIEANKLIGKTRTRGTFFVPVNVSQYGEATSVNIDISSSGCTVDFEMETIA